MNKDIVTKWGEQFKRVNKTVARRLYNNGESIYLMPNKTRFDNMWIEPYHLCNKGHEDFDKMIDYYIYYNCNSELGNYCAYYVQITNNLE